MFYKSIQDIWLKRFLRFLALRASGVVLKASVPWVRSIMIATFNDVTDSLRPTQEPGEEGGAAKILEML